MRIITANGRKIRVKYEVPCTRYEATILFGGKSLLQSNSEGGGVRHP